MNYKLIYLKSIGYDQCDFIPCEITGNRTVDIHHIIGRGKCGEDRIENLMALIRELHIKYGDNVKYMAFLLIVHMEFLTREGIKFDREYMLSQIAKYYHMNKLKVA